VARLGPSLVLALAAAVLALAGSGSAQVAFTNDRMLGALARESLLEALPEGTRPLRLDRMAVRCYLSRSTFERSFEQRFGASARKVIAYYAGGADIHLRTLTCGNVRSFVSGRRTLFTVAAFSVLLHEALHRHGLRNERLTTCFANEAVRWGAEWLGLPRADALRARNLAFDYTRRYAPPFYFMGRPTCLALARRTSWREHAVGR
jgi:AraC-like DNA-binding protein